jgi:hypothetical protein
VSAVTEGTGGPRSWHEHYDMRALCILHCEEEGQFSNNQVGVMRCKIVICEYLNSAVRFLPEGGTCIGQSVCTNVRFGR